MVLKYTQFMVWRQSFFDTNFERKTMRRSAIFFVFPFLFTSCLFDFSTDECESLTPIMPGNARLTNAYSECGENGFFKVFPGQAISIGYNGFDYGPGYDNLDFRWKFSSDRLFDAGSDSPLGLEQKYPAVINGGGSVGENVRAMDLTFYAMIPDEQIGKGDFETTIEVTAVNKCGESTPATARVQVVNSGNIIQDIRPQVPISISHHGQAYWNGKLYLLFGRRSVNDSKDNYAFDFEKRTWTKLPKINVDNFDNGFPLVVPDQELFGSQMVDPIASLQVGSKVFFLNSGGRYFYIYDLQANTLKRSSVSPGSIHLTGMAKPIEINGKMYVGPVVIEPKEPGFPNRNAIFSYDPVTDVWQQEAVIPDNLVTPPTVIGQDNGRGDFMKVAFAQGTTMNMVYENNQVMTFDINSKQLSVSTGTFMSNIFDYPASVFTFRDDLYFFHKPTTSGTQLYRKENMTGTPGLAFNFQACPRSVPLYWHVGSRATVINNTVVIVGGDIFGAKRVWLTD